MSKRGDVQSNDKSGNPVSGYQSMGVSTSGLIVAKMTPLTGAQCNTFNAPNGQFEIRGMPVNLILYY
jgi:hypothetical protein